MVKIEEIYALYLKSGLVSTDTRNIQKDSIFFALKGEHFNANEFAHQALELGATHAVVDEEQYANDPRCLLVENVLEALQSMAVLHRSHFFHPVIGITGSNGKTTSKELMNAVLSKKYKVHCTSGNFNNHIGVPLTILGLKETHELFIVEMGANHAKEIAFLCGISDPDFGLITNIGLAHLEGFGSPEMIKKTKLELYDHVKQKSGTLFVNAIDDTLMEASRDANRICYGAEADQMKMQVDQYGRISVSSVKDRDSFRIDTQLFGSYNYSNILGAIAVGRYFRVSDGDIKDALEHYQPQNNRSQIIERKDNLIILDAYNANPSSMKLAVDSFVDLPAKRKMLILGDMLELGEGSNREHNDMVRHLESLKMENVFLVGQEFGKTQSSYQKFETIDTLISWMEENPPKDFAVLIKGSRGIKLERALDSFS